MNTLKRHFDVTLTLLAPLHIGTGRELLRDYDYVTRHGQTWFLAPDVLLDTFVDEQGNFVDDILGRPAEELLKEADFRPDNPIFRYVIPGQPRAQGHGAVLREQIKDAFGRPYLPGSSLKGALRTVLAWHGYRQMQQAKLNVGAMRGNRGWAAQETERTLFGRSPNYDLLRMIQVADSEPLPISALQLVNAQVVTKAKEPGSPIECEALQRNKRWETPEIHTSISVDLALRTQAAAQQLGFGDRVDWVDELPAIAREWARARLAAERAWFAQRNHTPIVQLYTQMEGLLKSDKLGSNRFFLQLGWGGGWGSKTIGLLLQEDDREWQRLLKDRRLSPARIRRRDGDAFPKSRRVMMLRDRPVAPFGWCLVEINERI